MRFQNYLKNSPTKEMEEYFNDGSINKEDLEQRASTHDISKWSPDEYIPYVFFSWKKKYEKDRKEFNVPKEMDENFENAWIHHYKNNDHHPEFYCPPCGRAAARLVNRMPKQQMTEMVCDLAAMSQEMNNSLLDWIKNNTFKKYNFDQQHKDFILKISHYFE